jgi:hypothetical protein
MPWLLFGLSTLPEAEGLTGGFSNAVLAEENVDFSESMLSANWEEVDTLLPSPPDCRRRSSALSAAHPQYSPASPALHRELLLLFRSLLHRDVHGPVRSFMSEISPIRSTNASPPKMVPKNSAGSANPSCGRHTLCRACRIALRRSGLLRTW